MIDPTSSPASMPLILAVDDDTTTRLLIVESLRSAGFRVEEAPDGRAGVERFMSLRPDLVLMDVVMPNMDGFDACAAIRAMEGGDRVPILMATGLDDVESIHRAYEVGATDFITKPINWSLLGHRVRYMIRSAGTYERLLRSEAKNSALLDAVPDSMIRYDREGRILEVKFGESRVLQGLPDPVQGRMVQEVLPAAFANEATAMAAHALDDYVTQSAEFRLDAFDGSSQFFEARVVACGGNEVLAILRDITQRKRMESALRASEERFRSLIENASDLITLVDGEGTIRYESPAVARILGYEADALVGRTVVDLVHEDDENTLATCIRESLLGDHAAPVEQIRMRAADGSWRLMETICTPFLDSASERLVVMNSRDVTDRAEAERALRDSEEQLRQSQKMEAIGRLAGGVAHDFNNLLTAILGYAQMLEEELLSEGRSAEEAQEIRKAATRATSLTRQLLAFSRKQVLQTRVVNLGSIVSDMDKMLRRLLGEDVDLATETEGGLYAVKVDPGQMEQVILNLAVNARDAMPTGGRITLRTCNLLVDANRAESTAHLKPGAYVLLEVIDTGEGMDLETQAHMFEPFFTTKGKGKGTGLGLSTVYGIVCQSGGEIWVESAPGQGTTFRIAIPAQASEQSNLADRTERVEVLDGRETVLLVEDEAWVRGLVRKCLHRYGYTVLVAEDGQHAFELASGYKKPIDLMLTDVVMPRMNGVELAERLRPLRPDMQVLFMSGYTDHASLKSGAIDLERTFLQKPFTLEVVARKVRETLNRAEAAHAV